MEMELLRTLISKRKYVTIPDIKQNNEYTEIKITCWEPYAQQLKIHLGRDQALASIQDWLTAGWNIAKISTSNHEPTETLDIHINMEKESTPPRLAPKYLCRTTKTIYHFFHHNDELTTQELNRLSGESPIIYVR